MRLLGRMSATLSFLVLAAHFLRSGSILLAPSLLFAGLAWISHPRLQRVVQGALVLAAVEWMRTLLTLASLRQAVGLPWMRMAGILGAVAGLALLAAWALRPERRTQAA